MSVNGQAEQSDEQATGRPHPIRQVAGWLAGLVLVVLVGAAVAVSLVPAMAGATALTVLSGSMEPTLPVGSVAVVRPRSPDQIRTGDVITFTDRDPDSPATRTVTHRVVSVEQGPGGLSFRTKGDANNTPDQRPTAAADVYGVLWYSVPVAGWLREFLISRAGLVYLVGVVLLMVAAHLVLPKTRQPARGHIE
ncbi:MAG: signal peptidase I [Actinomycetota bacterium]|nr:signal peptidase I [Actinomycetota bacterium]